MRRRDRHTPNLLDPYKYSSIKQRREYAAGLRELAAWIEETDFPLHEYALGGNKYDAAEVTIHSTYFDESDQDFVRRVGSAARLIGGRVEKGAAYATAPFTLTRTFTGGVRFVFSISRGAVCEKKIVIKEVTKEMPVDTATAFELKRQKAKLELEIAALDTVAKMVTESVEEFVCPPSLIEAEKKAEVTPF